METRLRKILGEVLLVGEHGLYLDHDGERFYAVHMDGDGRVASREPFVNANDALQELKRLKEKILFGELEIPKDFSGNI